VPDTCVSRRQAWLAHESEKSTTADIGVLMIGLPELVVSECNRR